MKICWLAIRGPGVSRMATWIGETRLVTGITRDFAANCDCEVELPPGAEVHETPCDLPGYVFTVSRNWSPR
jgi:hypothetical protein